MGNVRSSGDITATGVVTAKPCRYRGMTVFCNTTKNNLEITLHDNASAAAGRVVDRMKLLTTQKQSNHHDANGVICDNGIYATFSASNIYTKIVVDFESL